MPKTMRKLRNVYWISKVRLKIKRFKTKKSFKNSDKDFKNLDSTLIFKKLWSICILIRLSDSGAPNQVKKSKTSEH